MLNWLKKIIPISDTRTPEERTATAAALHEQAISAMHRGETFAAIEHLKKALDTRHDFEDAYRDLCFALFHVGQIGNAKDAALRGLKYFPDSFDLNFYLGNLYFESGDCMNAADCYHKALALRPQDSAARFNLGRVQQELGELDLAIETYRDVVAGAPGFVDAHLNLGALLGDQGLVDEALACYKKALKVKPDCTGAHNNIGYLLKAQGKLEEALAAFRKELAVNPGMAKTHNNIGNVFQAQGKLDKAMDSYRQAAAVDPENVDAYQNLAQCYTVQRNLNAALECSRKVLELDPDFLLGRAQMLHVLQHLCRWDELDKHVDIVRKIINDSKTTSNDWIAPFAFLALPGTTAAEQRRCAEKFVHAEYDKLRKRREELDFDYELSRDRPIHIAYLSADFHQHATAFLMAEVFELHDRDRFRISAYSCGIEDGSPMRSRLKRAFDSFVDLRNLSDDEAARKIHDDKVDILVDLKGYTEGTRSAILAYRPAPIQVNYLGYPGTMGADFVDYLIADRFVIPPKHVEHYSEEVMWLDDCYQPNDRKRPIPQPLRRVECGLPEDGLVFCCFNQTYKITSEVFDVWCRLLTRFPSSVLWLLASNPHAEANLRQELAHRGVDVSRLIMAPPVSPDKHLARLQCADIFLDTLPYNAHTTCSDALWMGVPVVTCAGDTFPSRVAGSLLTAMEVPELITRDLDAYFALAADLAANPERRMQLRSKLLAKRDTAPLFDSMRFTRNLESVYISMLERYLAEGKHSRRDAKMLAAN